MRLKKLTVNCFERYNVAAVIVVVIVVAVVGSFITVGVVFLPFILPRVHIDILPSGSLAYTA